jgi:hypothetical protein
MAALNGMIAAAVVHVAGYYALEETGLLPGHRVTDDANHV